MFLVASQVWPKDAKSSGKVGQSHSETNNFKKIVIVQCLVLLSSFLIFLKGHQNVAICRQLASYDGSNNVP